MNTDELQARMTRSTYWTERAVVDPAPDVVRGRSRLRRRRVGSGAAAASVLAVAALAVGAVVTQLGPAPAGPAVAGDPSTRPEGKTGGGQANPQVKALTERYLATLGRHADPGRAHLYSDLSRQPLVSSNNRGRLTSVKAEAQWRQDGGVGYAAVEVVAPGNFDVADSMYRSTECLPGYATQGPKLVVFRYTSCRQTQTPTGQWVRIGTVQGESPKGYFASYVRPDGHLVIARVDGTISGRNPIAGTPNGTPVQAPDVTTAMLAAVVTDPGLALP